MRSNLLACTLVASATWMAGPALAQVTDAAAATATRAVKLLPYDVSRSLKIIRTPSTQPTPLIVGVYWTCHDAGHGHTICRITTVVCTNDQSQCAEV
jgi:hypothetical protein